MGCSKNEDGMWVHTIRGTYSGGGKLAAAHFHCHAPTCLSMIMYRCNSSIPVCNETTGELLCAEYPVYVGFCTLYCLFPPRTYVCVLAVMAARERSLIPQWTNPVLSRNLRAFGEIPSMALMNLSTPQATRSTLSRRRMPTTGTTAKWLGSRSLFSELGRDLRTLAVCFHALPFFVIQNADLYFLIKGIFIMVARIRARVV